MAPGQLAEKVNFACEAGVCNPFFASALPRQKTLLSQQVSRRRPSVLRWVGGFAAKTCARLGCIGGKVTLVTFSTV